MAITWFPGHMNKAKREIGRALKQVDLVIEVLDARAPYASSNPILRRLKGDKACIKVLNKSDLADPSVTKEWISHFKARDNLRAISLDKEKTSQIKSLLVEGRKMLPAERNKDRPVVAMIVGVPNVGKSTLINILAGRSIAKTGNIPAVTQHQQRISIAKKMVLLDTPGILWPRISPPACGYRLAFTGAIKDNQFDFEELSLFAAEFLSSHYPQALTNRYKLKDIPDEPSALLHAIAAKRGCLGKGGIPDLNRVSEILIREFRQGKLGRITLEHPSDIPVKDVDET
jgi:ribosome biogenesis GTPase A